MSTVLTRDAIKVIDDRVVESVEVPEWGGSIFVRGLSGTDRDSFEMAMIVQKKVKGGKTESEVNFQNLRAKLIVRCAVDSEDKDKAQPIFTIADIEWLGSKSGAALQRIYAVAQRLSGLSNEEAEELASDLGKDQNGSSGSDLPGISDTPLSLPPSTTSAAESSASGSLTTDSTPSEAAV